MTHPYNNLAFMTSVSLNVSDKLKRPITKIEQKYIVEVVKNLDEGYMRAKPISEVVGTLSHIIFKKICPNELYPQMDGSEYIDMRENLKQHIGTTSESNVSNSVFESMNKLQNTGKVDNIRGVQFKNPLGALRKSYFLLDSRYRNISSTPNRFIWDYSNSKTQQTGSVNIIGDIRDIVSIRIYSFRLPVSRANTKHKRITVLIHEFSTQSFFAHENRRFHFSLPYSVDENFLDINPFEQLYDYHFEKPFTTLPSITISFGNPLKLVNLDDDSGKCSADYTIIAPLTKIITQTPHGITTNDLVFFSNFNAGSSDKILKNIINREDGFTVTIISPTSFSIDYDTSSIISPITGLLFDVYYDSKRFYIPFEMDYIKPDI